MTNETPALDFKSATLYAIRLVLNKGDTEALLSTLDKRMKESSSFFEDEPVVIDATNLEGNIDWGKLLNALKAHRLPVIGVAAKGEHLVTAKAFGLSEVDLASSPIKPVTEPHAAATQTQAKADSPVPAVSSAPSPATSSASKSEPVQTMVVHGPLRSGQRIYARQRDLIVMGLVSQGAEVIADGNIHVYGPLRGKAMAGALGDLHARIFTTQFEPELVAVAGVYRVVDAKLSADIHKKAAMVSLDGQALEIAPLDQ